MKRALLSVLLVLATLAGCGTQAKDYSRVGRVCDQLGLVVIHVPDAGVTCYVYCGADTSDISCLRDTVEKP